jgi:hypothetical protein
MVRLNPTPETLTILARDENYYVRDSVKGNPNATREVIQTVRAYEFYQECAKLEIQETHTNRVCVVDNES